MLYLSLLSAIMLTAAAGIAYWQGDVPATLLIVSWTGGWVAALTFSEWLNRRRADQARLRQRIEETRQHG